MKCPQRHKFVSADQGGPDVVFLPCIKEECAWWEAKIGKCSVLRMWIALQDIHEVLHDIDHRLDALTGLKR